MTTDRTRAYWVVAKGRGELRSATLAGDPKPGHSRVRAAFSGISAGTERLVGLGLVPPGCETAMACRGMEGSFALPVKYGYCLVGLGVAGALAGRRVFTMHPHQELAEVADGDGVVLPDAWPLLRATLIPNTETALNAVWDAELTGGERCLVLGGSALGILVALALARENGVRARIVESDPERRAFAAACPWVDSVLAPDAVLPESSDVVFHCTGNPAGLDAALAALAFEGRVVELSWYGARPVTVHLGTHFHQRRLRILATQVGSVARSRRTTLGHAGRMARVLELLDDPAVDRLPAPPVAFARLPEFMAALYRGDHRVVFPTVAYTSE